MEILKGFARRHYFPHQLSFILESPIRQMILSPHSLAERLPLKENSTVLEVGAGSGYFSIEVARRIPNGRLELFDLQVEMLEKARSKAESAKLHNVGFTQGDACNLPYMDSQFDLAFLVAVLGEVRDRRTCLQGLYRVLNQNSTLSISEHLPDPDFSRLSTVRGLVEQEGFKCIEHFGRAWNYTVNFGKQVRL